MKMNVSARGKFLFAVGLILALLSTGAEARTRTVAAPAATAPGSPAHQGDPKLQEKRLAFMKKAIAFGLIAGIEDSGPVPRVLAGRKFMGLPLEEKEQIVNIVWAYYKTKDPQKNMVLVIDKNSGKEIGEYSLANRGLRMK